MKRLITIFSFLLLVVAFSSSVFIVDEGTQVVITEFGQPVGETIDQAGIFFKKPFIQDLRIIEKKIHTWDGDYTDQITTKDKKYIRVDTTARWKIINPLKFLQSVRDVNGARTRLDSILDGHTRNTISSYNLVEAIRNTNDILEKSKNVDVDEVDYSEEVMASNLETIEIGREKLSSIIAEKADKDLREIGIAIIDVQLRRISYTKNVEQKVFERMISERQSIAEKIRSFGKGEKAKIEGRLSKDLQRIESEAYRKAQAIRGEAEAKAISVYAQAFSKDPKFYEFVRSMEAYKKSISPDAKFIFSTNSEFLKFLN